MTHHSSQTISTLKHHLYYQQNVTGNENKPQRMSSWYINSSTEYWPYWEADSCLAVPRICLPFVKPEAFLPCEQLHTTRCYADPYESMHTSTWYSLMAHLILSYTPRSASHFLQSLPNKIFNVFISHICAIWPWFHYPNNIWCSSHTMKFPISILLLLLS